MSSSDIAVSVRGLSKSYSIAHNAAKHTTASEALMHKLRNPFAREERETFWALNDVNFDIQRGDVVGIIGRNGAGKSTLLKILSRITEPTTGQIDLYGRVGSLLEVGTGFHPELTGRENIFLNGAILGMAKSEITKQFDAIVDFSGTEQFLDTPVKRYSSGMYVRLAFAVAAHLNPEILIIDEVLAVGDAEFQKKCLGKMKDVAESGRTVLFVSHNMNAVSSLCNTAIMLSSGKLQMMDNTEAVIQSYSRLTQANHTHDLSTHPNRKATHNPILQSIELFDEQNNPTYCFAPLDKVMIKITVATQHKVASPRVGIGVTNSRGERIFAIATFLGSSFLPPINGKGDITGQFVLPPLVPGRYSLDIGFSDGTSEFLDAIFTATAFDVEENNFLNTSFNHFSEMGQIMVRSEWNLAQDAERLIYAGH
jgi:lipopolysaccharide transport system ATP-binding protein